MYGNLYLLWATLDICALSYLAYFSGGSGISGAEQIKLLKSVMGITQPGQFTMGIHFSEQSASAPWQKLPCFHPVWPRRWWTGLMAYHESLSVNFILVLWTLDMLVKLYFQYITDLIGHVQHQQRVLSWSFSTYACINIMNPFTSTSGAMTHCGSGGDWYSCDWLGYRFGNSELYPFLHKLVAWIPT